MKVLAHIKAFLKDEEGASGIEYALLGVMVAIVISVVSPTVSLALKATFNKIIVALGGTAVA